MLRAAADAGVGHAVVLGVVLGVNPEIFSGFTIQSRSAPNDGGLWVPPRPQSAIVPLRPAADPDSRRVSGRCAERRLPDCRRAPLP